MSKHKFKYDDLIVTVEWNGSLGYFSMTIENETSDIPVYDGISDAVAHNTQDTEHYKKVLRTLRIPAPEGFWLALDDDRLNSSGNSYTRWKL